MDRKLGFRFCVWFVGSGCMFADATAFSTNPSAAVAVATEATTDTTAAQPTATHAAAAHAAATNAAATNAAHANTAAANATW